MSAKTFFKKIHLWLSIPSGLIIVILCITGAILSFETEILESYYPERYFVESVKEKPLPLAELAEIANKQLDDNTISAIKVTSDPKRTYTGTLSEGFRISVFIDPYTGEIKGRHEFRETFFYDMMALHRWLMDGTRTWGKYTMGISTLLFVFILISGIVWWVPKNKKDLKRHLQVKTKYGMKRFLHDIHVSLGIYVSIFLLVCSLTGLMWSFDWYRNGVNKIFGVESERGRGNGKSDNKNDKRPINYSNWDLALSNFRQLAPNNKYITIADGAGTILDKSAPHLRATDKYKFDAATGETTEISLFSENNSPSKIMAWAYALHVGDFGGITVRILTCLACIIGGTMPLTGYYLLYRRKVFKTSKNSNNNKD